MGRFTLNTNKKSDKRGYKSQVYIGDCEITEIADDFFMKNEIFLLDFKCKTWAKIRRKVTSIHRPILLDYLNGEKVSYSAKAGCQCGCSPGYIVDSIEFTNRSLWGDFEFTEEEVAEFKEWMKGMPALLEKEKEKHQVAI